MLALPPTFQVLVRVRVLGVGTKCVFGWGSKMLPLTLREIGSILGITLAVQLLALLLCGLTMLAFLYGVGVVGFG